ncbi:MAG: BT4734/BF3469 family protein, partial [Paludibacteraceae bacterium]
MSRFCQQESVNRGTPQPCTREIFEGMLDDPAVKAVCERIGSLDPQAEGYADEKNRLKRQLPIIIPHAQSFKGTKRKSEDAEPSGLVMLDVDHIADPQSVYAQQVAPVVEAQRIYFAAITPSGHGLRLIAERLRGEAIEDAQCRLAKACGFEQIDGVTKDLARASYMMPREMVLHYDPQPLFEAPKEEDAIAAMAALPALPADDTSEAAGEDAMAALAALPTGDTSEAAGEDALPAGDTSEAAGEGAIAALAADEPAYKGIPYSAIAQQLMALIGSGDGAEQGERNTVYFSLANYMRYICDFNADLLLSALPAFGLSEEERRRTIHSALGRPRKNYIPATLQSAITICEQQRKTEKAFELTPLEELVKGVDLPRLPRLLQLVLKRVPETYRPALIIALLPVLGTLATRVRFLYLDKQKHSFSFFSCISAPAASGKSFIRKPIDLLLTPINEQ